MDSHESGEAGKLRSLDVDEIGDILRPDRMPITTEELIAECGDYEIRYPRGSERLETVLRTSGEETYETPDQLQLAILGGVSRDAVGRPRYSDRGDERDQELDREHQSF